MRYQVPQFIEVEDKIFGPFTIKQFLYITGGAALMFISVNLLGKLVGIIVGAPFLSFFLAMAFYKPNGRDFSSLAESYVKYSFSSKLYLWHKRKKTPKESAKNEVTEYKKMYVPKMSHSKLKDLSWGLDVKNDVTTE
jgi:hypothetical protein